MYQDQDEKVKIAWCQRIYNMKKESCVKVKGKVITGEENIFLCYSMADIYEASMLTAE